MENLQQTSNQYGLSQELEALAFLVNYGTVSIPYGNSGRYDCILDIQGDLYKIQIKSVNKTDEDTISIPFANTRMSANGSVKKEYTEDEVDYIGIIYQHNMYLFPSSMATKSLTVKISKEKLHPNSHLLEDFSIEKTLDIDLNTWVSLKEETRLQNQGQIKEYKCIDCGAPVSQEGNRCISCARVQSRKVDRPNREELKTLIRNTSFSAIGKQFGVTDNTIRKWCKSEKLPHLVREIKQISDEKWRTI